MTVPYVALALECGWCFDDALTVLAVFVFYALDATEHNQGFSESLLGFTRKAP